MNITRIKELMTEADNERLSYGEIAEIENAYNEIPDDQLPDLRENASIIDMLIELETQAEATK